MPELGAFIEQTLRHVSAEGVTNSIVLALLGIFAAALVTARRGAYPGFVRYAPNLLTSLGIFGTFVGIVIGLLAFDVSDIDGSIGPLLAGLKTAFITSLTGMLLAMVFKTIDSTGKLRPKAVEEAQGAVGPEEILNELRLQRYATERLTRAIEGDEDSTLISQVRLLRTDGQEQAKAAMGEYKAQTERQLGMSRTLEQLRLAVAGEEDSALISQIRLLRADGQEHARSAMEQLKKQSERQLAMSLALDRHQERFDAFATELWRKLDEFAEMLSKSATEAVINALKEVIADFNRNLTEQFGENFKELNAAVERLVQWQENYRLQLEQMSEQYAQGVQAITSTEQSVAHISEESKQIPVAMGELKTLLQTTQHQLNELERHLEAFKDMRDRAVEAVPEIRQQMDSMAEQVSAATRDAGQRILAATEGASEVLQQGAEEFTEKLKGSIQGMVDDVGTAVKDAGEQIMAGSQGANQAIVQGAEEFKNNVNRTNQGLTSAADQLASNSERIREQMDSTLSDINNHVRNMVNELVEQSRDIGKTLIDSNRDLQTSTKEAQHQVTDGIEKMQKRLESALEEVFQAQTREMNKVFNALDEEVRKSVDTTGKAVNEQLKAMDEAMQQEVERVMSEMARALGAISKQFTNDYRQLVDAMRQVVGYGQPTQQAVN